MKIDMRLYVVAFLLIAGFSISCSQTHVLISDNETPVWKQNIIAEHSQLTLKDIAWEWDVIEVNGKAPVWRKNEPHSVFTSHFSIGVLRLNRDPKVAFENKLLLIEAYDGCNSFNLEVVDVSPQAISTGQLYKSKINCDDLSQELRSGFQNQMQLFEKLKFSQISLSLDQDILSVNSNSGLSLKLKPKSEQVMSLYGIWKIDGIENQNGDFQEVPRSSEEQALFAVNRTHMSIKGMYNTFGGKYVADTKKLEPVKSYMTTLIGSNSEEELNWENRLYQFMQQSNRYDFFRKLTSNGRPENITDHQLRGQYYSQVGDTLKLKSPEGHILIATYMGR